MGRATKLRQQRQRHRAASRADLHRMADMADVVCFRCNGKGQVFTHLHFADRPGEWRCLRCATCDGLGLVSLTQKRAWDEGTRRRDLRVAARLSQREMAQRLGITPQTYSRMEHGIEPWPAGSEAAFVVRGEEE